MNTAINPTRFVLAHTAVGGYSSTIPPGPELDKEMLRHGVAAFGFLLERGARVTGPEFAARIRRVYTHPRALEVAATLEKY